MYKLGVVQLIPHPVLDTFRQAAIEELAQQGFVESKNLTIDYQDALGDVTTAATIASKFAGDGVDAIFCITTPACIAAAKSSTSIPLIIGYVTDPVSAGLVTQLKQPGGNITGVLAPEVVEQQMLTIREIVPDAKMVGVLWNQGEPNSRTIVDKMKQYAAQNTMTIVDANATTSGEVATAAQSLVGNVDVIFIPGDNTAQSALQAVVQICETNKIPLLTSDHKSVEQGAIAAYSYFEQDVGKQAGVMIARVLGGQSPAELDLELPTDFKLSINQGAAQRMGVTIPDAAIKRAARVIP
jgi:putative ABC transport system substrate-binding protein